LRGEDGNVLLAGDEVWIPEPREKKVAVTTGETRRVRLKAAPTKLRLYVLDGARAPRKDVSYTVEIDGAGPQAGMTSAAGLVEADVPVGAAKAILRFDWQTIVLNLGELDPIGLRTGQIQRLRALGCFPAAVGDEEPDEEAFGDALRRFQSDFTEMDPTGVPDDETLRELRKVYTGEVARASGRTEKNGSSGGAPGHVEIPVFTDPEAFAPESTLPFFRADDQKAGGGALWCSRPIPVYRDAYPVSPNTPNTIVETAHEFLYLDVGVWAAHQQSFAVVARGDVYLCDYVPRPTDACLIDPPPRVTNPKVDNELVQEFFSCLGDLGHEVRMVKHAQVRGRPASLVKSERLHVLLPDSHMPPITWWLPNYEDGITDRLFGLTPGGKAISQFQELFFALGLQRYEGHQAKYLPGWFRDTEAYTAAQGTYESLACWLESQDWFGKAGEPPKTFRPSRQADIFGPAAQSLADFVRGITQVSRTSSLLTRGNLSVVHLGDLFEVWIGTPEFLFQEPKGEQGELKWADNAPVEYADSPSGKTDAKSSWMKAVDYLARVMLLNMSVIDAMKDLSAALRVEQPAEAPYNQAVTTDHAVFLWGNHEAYLMDRRVSDALGIDARHEDYVDPPNHLFAEHGHLWDEWNRDTAKQNGWVSGYSNAQKVQWHARVRDAEGIYQNGNALLFTGEDVRYCYYRGAAFRYLMANCFPAGPSWPLGIFAMGHTHERQLTTVRVRPGVPSERAKGIVPGVLSTLGAATKTVGF
jgi:hypothetical protein